MKFLAIPFVLFFVFAAQAQTVIKFNSGLPANWSVSGNSQVDTTVSRETGGSSIRLAGLGSSFQTSSLVDVGEIRYWIRSPQVGDDLTVAIEFSEDNNKWQPLTTFDVKNNPSQADDVRLFIPLTKSIDGLGNLFFRWKISRDNGGAVFIDEINFVSLSATQKAILTRNKQEQVIRQIAEKAIADVLENKSYAEAQTTFNNSKGVYRSNLQVLAGLMQHANAIDALMKTAKANQIRNDMANPTKYASFTKIASDLQTVLPATKRSRVGEILGTITNVASLAVNVTTGFNFRGIIDSFKSMLADGYSPSNLSTMYTEKERTKSKLREYTDKLNQGVETYNRTSRFLDGILIDYERLNRINEKLDKADSDATAFRQELDQFLIDYLTFVGAENASEIRLKIIQNAATVLNQTFASIDAKFNKNLGTSAEFGNNQNTLSPDQRLFLRRMETLFQRLDTLKSRYAGVTDSAWGYYVTLQSDLGNNTNPFGNPTASPEAKQWEDSRVVGKDRIDAAVQLFKDTHKDIRF